MPKLLVAAIILALALPFVPVASSEEPAAGAMTCDFAVDPSGYAPDELAGAIERDRMYMAERPGMLHKHIPLAPSTTSPGKLASGGRYLFATEELAKDYLRWIREEFVLDGVPFFQRSAFSDVDCHSWSTIGSAELGDIHTVQITLRTERWATPAGNQRDALREAWPAIRDEAQARGLSAVWLLYQKQEGLATIVSFAPRLALSPDAGLAVMAASPTLGPTFDEAGWPRTMDRTHWVFNVWFPYEFADSGEAALWPNSPLLPEPSATDGVCVPSRGETHATAPEDCTPHCGDGIPDEDETTRNCPSDVRLA